MNRSDNVDAFVSLSVALTGFSRVDLQGTGLVAQYAAELQAQLGDVVCAELLAAWARVEAASEPLDVALRQLILSDPVLGAAARNLIKMWYLGQWGPNRIVSGQAYQQALVWDAIGAHPQAAKQPGFGSWSLPPGDGLVQLGRAGGKGGAS